MTTLKKAKQLYNAIYNTNVHPNSVQIRSEIAKQCALIAIDEIMYSLSAMPYGLQYISKIDYWEEVKTEINKL